MAETFGVDPTKIPKSMTRAQLEWWILFGICVAGKGAQQTEAKVNAFLSNLPYPRISGQRVQPSDWFKFMTPFKRVEYLRSEGKLLLWLRKHKMGQYKRINAAFKAAIQLDLSKISVELLETVPGIGPKTARMIMLYYDPQADCVPLDTHILKYLRANGYDAPKSTPSGKKYLELENAFRVMADIQGVSVRELDTKVWKSYAKIKEEKAV